MDKDDLAKRTKQFALRIMKLVDALPNTAIGRAIGGQLIRCGTGVGSNYRAACRSRSTKEFVSKLGTVLEEADESIYWIELIIEGKVLPEKRTNSLVKEAKELASIMAKSRITASKRKDG